MIKPLVSICCLTYNHQEFIRECLNGFLMQKTTFNYEILIHDDASTDKTTNIIKEYELKNPDLVKPVYQIENQFSKGVRVNTKFNFPRCKGKYIALCEGDDFWTDPLKLQKQVDFLEKNPSYSICGTRVQVYNRKGTYQENKSKIIGRVKLDDVLRTNHFGTCSVVFRAKHLTIPPFDNSFKFFTGDWPLWCSLLTKGEGFNMDEIMAQYNSHAGGIVSGRNRVDTLNNKLEDRLLMMDNFPGKKGIIQDYGNKIILHYLWKSLLLQKNYCHALWANRKLVWSFLFY